MQAGNWQPFAPNGWAGVQAGAAIVFFAYIGFDAVSTVAEETRNPDARSADRHHRLADHLHDHLHRGRRGLHRHHSVRRPGQKLATEQAEPLTMALQYANIGRWSNLFVGIVAFGSVVAHTAVLLVFQLGQPRIFFSMARDGLLPPSFAQRASALPDAARHDDPDRRRGRRVRDVHEHRRDGGPDEHRDAVRVHPGVHRHSDSAQARPGPAARVQDAVGAAGAGARRALVRVSDAGAAVDHVGAIRAVAGRRAGRSISGTDSSGAAATAQS